LDKLNLKTKTKKKKGKNEDVFVMQHQTIVLLAHLHNGFFMQTL